MTPPNQPASGPAPQQKIMWTCLPNGIDPKTGNLQLSLLVSPRLDSGSKAPRLDTFPDFSPWPALVRTALQFTIQILTFDWKFTADLPSTAVKRMPPDPAGASPDPDAALWTRIFPPATVVRPYGPMNNAKQVASPVRSQGGIRSYPVRNVVAYVKRLHQDIASTSPEQALTLEHPVIAEMVRDLGPVAANDGGVHSALAAAITGPARITARTNPSALKLPSSVSKAGLDFFQMYSFYNRRSAGATPTGAVAAGSKPGEAPLDFHQMVTALGDYPQILRLLGLIIDLEIPRAGLPADALIRVTPQWTPARSGQDITPWTTYTIDTSFSAKPVPVGQGNYLGLDHGLIKLTGVNDRHDSKSANIFEIVQVDADGAGIKHFNAAATLHSRSTAARPAAPAAGADSSTDASLPAIRSAGLSVIRVDRANAVESAMQQAAAWNDAPSSPLPAKALLQRLRIWREGNPDFDPPDWFQTIFHSDDLLRGYRIDILDENAPVKVWRSLCERVGKYQFKDGSSLSLPPDEGYVKAVSATTDAANNLYIHESMFCWAGWSLCARRPGKTIVDQQAVLVSNDAPPGIELSISIQPRPGSLPRLRYGHSYRVRIRAVDLVGNGLKLDPAPPPDPTHPAPESPFSDSVVFTRFEQIDPPVVVFRDASAEGESVERMVIRSNYNQTARDYSHNAQVLSARNGKAYNPVNERHLAPPKMSQLMAEWHGMFDKAVGSDKALADHDAGYRVARREAGTFADTKIIDVATGAMRDVPTVRHILNADGGGEYIIHTEEQLLVPYLPDCIARGALLRWVPQASQGQLGDDVRADTEGFIKVPFAGSWPDNKPFRIRIQERLPGTMSGDVPLEKFTDTGQPQWDPNSRILTVFLGKGQVGRITYGSYPDVNDVMANGVPDGVPQFGQLKWRIERLSPPQDDNDPPSLTPAQGRQITTWVNEIVQGISSSSPARELVLVHAVQQPLCSPVFVSLVPDLEWAPTWGSIQTVSLLGKTSVPLDGGIRLSRCSTGRIDIFADWKEWVDNPAEPRPKQIKGHSHVAELQVPDGVSDSFGWGGTNQLPVRHEFGDTKYRSVDYHALATTRFREYFAPAITQDPKNITREGPAFNVKIPSRARPAAPKVLYVVPTFGWEGIHDPTVPPKPLAPGASIRSRRLGGGIRVYLERPWFSSGDGELLGVVLWPYNPPLHDQYKNLVTQWGKDPIFASANPPTPAPAPPGNFTGTALTDAGKPQTDWFSPVEIPADAVPSGIGTILVIGYPVHYDEQSRRWYADIQFDAGSSYCPFIRLALARYQPNSMEDAKISPVVMADFAQLLPDRTANIQISADMKVLTVEVLGIEPAETYVSKVGGAPLPFDGRNRIEVAMEMEDPNNNDPDLGWLPASNVKVEGNKPPAQTGQLWKGTVTIPGPLVPGKFRLVIQEFESHFEDGAHPQDRVFGKRIVYADTINL
jgi:hypothetical protein